MSEDTEENSVYNLLIDEDDELRTEVKKILESIFETFDKDKDGKWKLTEIQDFAIATNGEPFSDSDIEDIINCFDVDEDNNLKMSGFYQLYHTQTISEPEETLNDLKKHGYNDQLKLISP